MEVSILCDASNVETQKTRNAQGPQNYSDDVLLCWCISISSTPMKQRSFNTHGKK